MADLQWLGLSWDEGPYVEGGPYGPYRQSERSDIYQAAAQRLLQDGKAYRCFCTPEELDQMKAEQEAEGKVFQYDGRWRDADPQLVNKMLDEQRPFTVRFAVPNNARIAINDVVRGTVTWDAAATVGDFILLRSTGVPVYNFCVAVDDAAMGISTVVRAEEHLTNTVRQALVLDALGAPRPRYAHCALILGTDKQKLSKRHGATSCDQYRLDGILPDAMINYLALLGWNDGTENEIFTRQELIEAFDLDRVVKSPSVFDVEKLRWVNSQHLKLKNVDEILPLVDEQMDLEGFWKEGTENNSKERTDFALAATTLSKQMLETTKDVALNAKTVLGYNLPTSFDALTDASARDMIQMGHLYPLGMRILEQYDEGAFPLPTEDPLSTFRDSDGQVIPVDSASPYTKVYKTYMKALAKEVGGVKGKNFFHPVRLILTGEMSGQDVSKQLSLLELASTSGECLAKESIGVVDFSTRMEHLRKFLATIPAEFQSPMKAEETKKLDDKSPAAKSSTDTVLNLSPGVDDPKESYDGPPVSALDIRVGLITKVWEHEEADKLFCEEIDVGEDEPRLVASGLRPYMEASDLEGRKVLVLCNLKARKMVGFPSHGMVLCASNSDHSKVQLVNPPVDSVIGERVTIPELLLQDEEAYAENKMGKKKIFEKLAPYLVTNEYGVPEFLGRPFMTSAGICTSAIPDGSVS